MKRITRPSSPSNPAANALTSSSVARTFTTSAVSIEAAVSSSSAPPTEAAWLATSTSTLAERDPRGGEDGLGRLRVGEVGLEVARQPLAQRDVAGAPRLRGVMGLPALGEDGVPVGDQAAGDREADALAPADAGHQCGAPCAQSPSSCL